MKVLLCSLFFATALHAQSYGEKLAGNLASLKISDIEAHYKSEQEKPIALKAKVEKVCEKKGCWMRLRDDSGSVRVSFKGYSFFVPMSLEGKTVQVEGVVKKINRSVKDQRHFLKDEGASKAQLDEVTTDKLVYEFEAYAVDQQ